MGCQSAWLIRLTIWLSRPLDFGKTNLLAQTRCPVRCRGSDSFADGSLIPNPFNCTTITSTGTGPSLTVAERFVGRIRVQPLGAAVWAGRASGTDPADQSVMIRH